jgi:hypothetical protein
MSSLFNYSLTKTEEQKYEVCRQKTLREFGYKPKQNMLLNLNPILINDEDADEQLYKLRNYMEDPSNKLEISSEMTIMGDNKDQILDLVNSIC